MTPPERLSSRLGWGACRFGVSTCVVSLLLLGPGIASAADPGDGASVDDVMMQVVEDPEADEREYVQDIDPPGLDRASDERSPGSSAGERGEAAGERPADAGREASEAASEARDAADNAREAAEEAREGAQDARDAGPPEAAGPADDAGPPEGD